MNLWDQYQAAVEEHRIARQHANRVCDSILSNESDRHHATCAAARAAQRAVRALQAYRDDLLSGLDEIVDDADEFTTVPESRQRRNPAYKIDGERRPITALSDDELDEVCHEYAGGRISVPDLADRWSVSTFALIVLLQSRGSLELKNGLGRQLGHVDYTVRMRVTRPAPSRVAIDYEAVARDRKAGLGYREIGERHSLGLDRTRNALRQCRRMGLLPSRDAEPARYVLVSQYIRDNPLKSHEEVARHFGITGRQLTADLYAAKKSKVINKKSPDDCESPGQI